MRTNRKLFKGELEIEESYNRERTALENRIRDTRTTQHDGVSITKNRIQACAGGCRLNQQERANRMDFLIGEIEQLDSSVEQETEAIFEYRRELIKLEQETEIPYWKKHEQDVIE